MTCGLHVDGMWMTCTYVQSGVGLKGPLVDRDGYPRSDIDVYAVRVARNKIICE